MQYPKQKQLPTLSAIIPTTSYIRIDGPLITTRYTYTYTYTLYYSYIITAILYISVISVIIFLIHNSFYLVYFPARANESTMKIINTPRKQYSTSSSITCSVRSLCCSSSK